MCNKWVEIISSRVLRHLDTGNYMFRSPTEVSGNTIRFFSSNNVSNSLLTEGCQSSNEIVILRREGREIYGGQSAHIIVRQIWGYQLFASTAALHNTPVAVSDAFHIE